LAKKAGPKGPAQVLRSDRVGGAAQGRCLDRYVGRTGEVVIAQICETVLINPMAMCGLTGSQDESTSIFKRLLIQPSEPRGCRIEPTFGKLTEVFYEDSSTVVM
jgi:hypothetical protein